MQLVIAFMKILLNLIFFLAIARKNRKIHFLEIYKKPCKLEEMSNENFINEN
jgi:hypothetical protein